MSQGKPFSEDVRLLSEAWSSVSKTLGASMGEEYVLIDGCLIPARIQCPAGCGRVGVVAVCPWRKGRLSIAWHPLTSSQVIHHDTNVCAENIVRMTCGRCRGHSGDPIPLPEAE